MYIFKSEAAAVSQRYLLVRIVMYCAEAQSDVIFSTGTREAGITEKAHLLSDVLFSVQRLRKRYFLRFLIRIQIQTGLFDNRKMALNCRTNIIYCNSFSCDRKRCVFSYT